MTLESGHFRWRKINQKVPHLNDRYIKWFQKKINFGIFLISGFISSFPIAALRAQLSLLNKLGLFAGATDGVEARRYRDSRNKRKDFKRGIGVGMSHIRLEGRLEKEEEIREERIKKKQKNKDNREARKTQEGLDIIAKNIAREK